MRDYLIADVFTSRPFGGNPLAVVPDAAGLSPAQMQAMAREFNLSETTFVLAPTTPGADAQVRIFTPTAELPFAGHPTIGTAAVLARLGRVPTSGRLVLQEAIGLVPVTIHGAPPATECTLTLDAAPEPLPTPPSHAVAAALSLPEAALHDRWAAALGIRFAFARLESPAAVDAARPDATVWRRHPDLPPIYLFAETEPGRLHARMFGPPVGVEEDPATGSAAAILAGSLAARTQRGVVLAIRQGVAMGRESLIQAEARLEAGMVRSLRVGGASVIVAAGQVAEPGGAPLP
jgi:trans-2,3-dihydro-3-hydroxyanthranilate isomerase